MRSKTIVFIYQDAFQLESDYMESIKLGSGFNMFLHRTPANAVPLPDISVLIIHINLLSRSLSIDNLVTSRSDSYSHMKEIIPAIWCLFYTYS